MMYLFIYYLFGRDGDSTREQISVQILYRYFTVLSRKKYIVVDVDVCTEGNNRCVGVIGNSIGNSIGDGIASAGKSHGCFY